MQMAMSNLKLRAFGWRRIARVCEILIGLACSCMLVFVVWWICNFFLNWDPSQQDHWLCTFATVVVLVEHCFVFSLSVTLILQSIVFLCAAYRAARYAFLGHDSAMCWRACCFLVNAVMIILGPLLSISATSWHTGFNHPILKAVEAVSPIDLIWIGSTDIGLQVLNVLLLSGMIGPQGFDLKAFKNLALMSGYGLASKRIAFPGKINSAALDCIVSFPGKYSEEWDTAVKTVTDTEATGASACCSLACVFLTDRESGLGQHVDMPDKPGHCWCEVIYGRLPASAYLSVVNVNELHPGDDEQQVLAFKFADARAMGQELLVKRDQSELEWEREKAEALYNADQLCQENHGRAPWGCMWFESWRLKVEEAVQSGQTLHVFYFEGKVGKGKMAWHELSDQEAKDKARRDTGLGASQTAEVAYLEKEGHEYIEHDITGFTSFITEPRARRLEHQTYFSLTL